jgi:hypothetical protein
VTKWVAVGTLLTERHLIGCNSNSDSSDTPNGSRHSTKTPQIHLTLNGQAFTFTDTGQILNTGGKDFGTTPGRNESLQWRLVGTSDAYLPGGSGVRPPAVLTWHNNNARTGLNSKPTPLTPINVNASNFGILWQYAVDGQVYAQPLFVPNVDIAGVGRRNIIVVATQNNSVWAFDAESNASGPNVLWGPVSLGAPVTSSLICNVTSLRPSALPGPRSSIGTPIRSTSSRRTNL